MSYHVTILRTTSGKKIPIVRDEIESIIASRKDLQVTSEGEGQWYIKTIAPPGPSGATLTWEGGEIWTKNPDEATMALMLELAAALGARVRGDELETYRTVEETYSHPDDRAETEAAQRATREVIRSTRRKQWALNAALLATLMLLAMIVSYLSRR